MLNLSPEPSINLIAAIKIVRLEWDKTDKKYLKLSFNFTVKHF